MSKITQAIFGMKYLIINKKILSLVLFMALVNLIAAIFYILIFEGREREIASALLIFFVWEENTGKFALFYIMQEELEIIRMGCKAILKTEELEPALIGRKHSEKRP